MRVYNQNNSKYKPETTCSVFSSFHCLNWMGGEYSFDYIESWIKDNMDRKGYHVSAAMSKIAKSHGHVRKTIMRDDREGFDQPIAISITVKTDRRTLKHAVVLLPGGVVADSGSGRQYPSSILWELEELGSEINERGYYMEKSPVLTDSVEITHLDTKNYSSGTNTKQYIMLHHTATGYGSIDGVLRTLTTGNVSCHYVVDTNGDIYEIGNNDMVLWHAGTGYWDGISDAMNYHAIGIEIIGPLPGFTDKQRDSVAYLVAMLADKHDTPIENIIRHKDYSPTRKVDVDDSLWNANYDTREAYRLSLTEQEMTESQKKVREASLNTGLTVNGEMYQSANEETRKALGLSNNAIREVLKNEGLRDYSKS